MWCVPRISCKHNCGGCYFKPGTPEMSKLLNLDFLSHETNLLISFHTLNSFFPCLFLEGRMHINIRLLGIHIFRVTSSHPFPNLHIIPVLEVIPGGFWNSTWHLS